MVNNEFGGQHTVKKLETVADYLDFYTTALKNKRLKLSYFDGFAGTGFMHQKKNLPLLSDVKDIEIMKGSALRSLDIRQSFDSYHFVEKSKAKAEKLQAEVNSKYSHRADKVKIEAGDVKKAIKNFCANLVGNKRAVVFLDPFGNQVNWSVLETIAATERVDLWYLFPSGLGVVRQLRNDGSVVPDARKSIDELFGTPDWIQEFTSHKTEPDLFGLHEYTAREIDADAVTRYMIKRMRSIFKGGVLDTWLPLGKDKAQWYSLIFACANPRHKANALAIKGAKAILSRK